MAKGVCCAAMSILALLLLAADSAVPAMQPAPGVPSLLQSGIPEIPAELKERVGQYLNARAASLLDVSDDGGIARRDALRLDEPAPCGGDAAGDAHADHFWKRTYLAGALRSRRPAD